ncbi:alpha/beta fold hydrolase [Myxococcaceae bacterium GXIMD 01537]
MSDARLSRRELLGGAVALGAALPAAGAGSPAPARRARRTFVLVHGSWHGGWCWRKVVPLLREAGHDVFAPTLSGLGDRAHTLTRDVGLSTHIQDVVELLHFDDLRDVILVGHSYAGMVISGVAGQVAERLSRLVYLDAFVPTPGQSGFDNMSPRIRQSWRNRAAKDGEGWWVPPFMDAKALGVTDPADAAWVDQRLRRMPIATFEQPVRFSEEKLAGLARTYLRCAGFGGFGPTAERLRAKGWDVRDLPCGHDAMLAAPVELSQALLALAAG